MVTYRSFVMSCLAPVLAGMLASPARRRSRVASAVPRDDRQRAGAAAPIRFQAMDTDHDGVITRAEWRGSDEAFRQQDTNHDGVLSGKEVAPRPSTQLSVRQRDELVAQFTRADRDGDRRLRRNEWTLDLGSFEQADANGDGMVTRGEFLNCACSRRQRRAGMTPAVRSRIFVAARPPSRPGSTGASQTDGRPARKIEIRERRQVGPRRPARARAGRCRIRVEPWERAPITRPATAPASAADTLRALARAELPR